MKMDDDSEFSMSGSDDGGSVSVAVSRGGSAQPEGVRRGSRRQSSAQQPAGRGTQPRPREKRQRIRPHGSRSQSAHLTDSERLHAFALLDEFARTHNGNLHGGKAFVAKALGVSGTTMTRVYKDWVERHERGIPYQANSSVQANTSIGSNLSSVSNLSAAAGAQQPVQASAQPPAQSPAAQFKRQLPSPAYPQQQKQQQQPTAPIERESISPAESYRRNQIPGIQLPIPPQPAFQQFPQPQQAYQNPPFQPPQPSYPQQPSYPPQQSYPQQQSYDQQPYPAQQPYPQQQQQFQQQQPYYRPQYYSPNQPFSPQQPFYDYNDHAPSPYPEAPPYTGFGFEERLVSPTGPEPLFTGPPNILPHRASLSGTLDPPLFPADHSNDSKGRDRGGFTSKESEEEEEEEEEDFGPLVPPESLQAERKAHDVDEICHRGAFLNLLCQHMPSQPLPKIYAEYMTLLARRRETPESPGGGFNPREMYHVVNSPLFEDFDCPEEVELTSKSFGEVCGNVYGVLQKISFTPGSLSQFSTPQGLYTLLDTFPKMPLPNEPTSRFAVERCAPHVLRWHIACPHDPGLMEHKEYLRIIYAAFCIRMAELCGEEVKVRVGRRVPGTCNFSLEFRFPRSKFGTPTKEEHAEVMGEGAFDGMGSTGFGAFGLDMEGGLGGVM